jgi:hypothetical protein
MNEMGAKGSIDSLTPDQELYTCPECGYTDGFHVSFQKAEKSNTKFHIVLICPSCHKRYRLGWEILLSE